jgi:hypothetical protein
MDVVRRIGFRHLLAVLFPGNGLDLTGSLFDHLFVVIGHEHSACFVWIEMGITAQKRIQVFDTAKIRTDGYILMSALVLIGSFGDIPWTIILLPFHLAGWRRHFNIHVRPA